MEKDYDSRLNKDRALGVFIAKNLKKDSDVKQCPSIEDIAALVDGKLDGEEKEKIVAHITACQDCYEIFSETSRTILSLSKSKRDKITWFSIPAVALAACLILVVRIVFYSPGTNLPYSNEMIGELAFVLKTDDVKPGLIARGEGFSGLADSLGLLTLQQQQSFRLGFYIASLDLATTVGGEPEQAQEQLSELGKILKWKEHPALTGSFKQLEGFLAQERFIEASEELDTIQRELGAEMKEETTGSFYHLGMWCSIGQVVFKSDNREGITIFLSNQDQLKAMQRLLEEEGTPQAIVEGLAKIIVLAEGDTLGDPDYQDILKHIQKITDYFMI